jgi:hypothetical protein
MAARTYPASRLSTRLVAVLVVVLAISAPPAAAQTPFTCLSTQDAFTCAALGALYASTNGAAWTTKTGWVSASAGTATSYCTFHGVTCGSGSAKGAVATLCAPLPCAAGGACATPTPDVSQAAPADERGRRGQIRCVALHH